MRLPAPSPRPPGHETRPPRATRRGAAAVELALVLPFLSFLFVVATDYCRVFYCALTVQNCARNGAIYACDTQTAGESPYADVTAAGLADGSNLSPAPAVSSTSGVDADGNNYVEVTASYTFQTITNYPGIPSTVDLTRTVRMRKLSQTPK